MAIFPLVEFPGSKADKKLGTRQIRVFFSLWLQKIRESRKTHGGGKHGINLRPGNKDWGFWGWEVKREMSGCWTIGAEIFLRAAGEKEGDDDKDLDHRRGRQ